MRSSILVPVVALLIVGGLGWVFVFSGPPERPLRAVEVPVDPEVFDALPTEPDAPAVAAAPTQEPPPPPQQPSDPSMAERPQATRARAEADPEPPPEPEPEPEHEEAEAFVPPDPEAVLALPPHLVDATHGEQRDYFEALKVHHERMLEQAREQLEAMDADDDPGTEQDREHLRRMLREGQASLEMVAEHLEDF